MKNGIFLFSKGAEFASAANANEGHQHIFSCETRVRFQLPLVFTPFWYKNERHDNKYTESFCPAFLSAKAESRTSADDIHHWRLSWGVHYSFSSRVKAICLRLILRCCFVYSPCFKATQPEVFGETAMSCFVIHSL